MKPVQEMNVTELKARGYDLMANIQYLERELTQTNQLIAQKAAMEQVPLGNAEAYKAEEQKEQAKKMQDQDVVSNLEKKKREGSK